MAAEQVHFIYTGGSGDIIPREATHVTIDDSITVIPANLFSGHPNIIELICHEGVESIRDKAFFKCRRLKRVVMLGVRNVGKYAFYGCKALIFVESPKLETTGLWAFSYCESLSSINLQSVKVVEREAFAITALTNATFGSNLESLEDGAFYKCSFLERITLPLKDGLNLSYSAFTTCSKLTHADIVERAVLNETVDALFMDNWRDDMNSEIAAINQSLPNTFAGTPLGDNEEGGKTRVIQEWIRRILRKIADYKVQHRHVLNEASSTLQLVLPCDIVLNNIVSFLELPPHTFDVE